MTISNELDDDPEEEEEESRLRETVAGLSPSDVIADLNRFCISCSADLTRLRYLWMAATLIWAIHWSSSLEGAVGLFRDSVGMASGGTGVGEDSVGVTRAAAAAEALEVERLRTWALEWCVGPDTEGGIHFRVDVPDEVKVGAVLAGLTGLEEEDETERACFELAKAEDMPDATLDEKLERELNGGLLEEVGVDAEAERAT